MTQRRKTYIEIPILLVINMAYLFTAGHPQAIVPLLPYFDVVKEELFLPLPLDSLKVTVDSIIDGIDRKIAIDQEYFHSNNFNDEEREVVTFLMFNSRLSIDGWFNNCGHIVPTQRLYNISEYYRLRDWYHANIDRIDWFYYAELAMEDMGYHLKRDSTGVYAERDSTTLHWPVGRFNNEMQKFSSAPMPSAQTIR